MSIFKRKRAEKQPQDTLREDNLVDIEPYAPHQGLSAAPYREPQVMTELKTDFRTHVSEFLDKTSPDQYNSKFTDNIVNRAREQAMRDLEIQRTEHYRVIERAITSLWRGDEHHYQNLLGDYDREYEQIEKDLGNCRRMLHKGTAYEEFDQEV